MIARTGGDSITLGRGAGIPAGVHYTWLLVGGLVAWSLAGGYFPRLYPDWDGGTYWLAGVGASLALFVSVVLHELGHALVATRRGIPMQAVTLYFFGGVASLEREAERPGDELLVAGAGPLTSLILAGLAWAGGAALPGGTPGGAVLSYLAGVNLLLAVFNLLPGFPLDGGRVLRSILWRATGSLSRATDLACTAGQVMGLLLVVAGVVQVLREALVSGLWIILIGWLLTRAAEQARGAAASREHVRRVAVGEIIDPRLPAGPPSMPVAEFVHEHVVRRGQRALLVVGGGRLIGLVSLSDAEALPRAAWASTPVGRIMTTAPLLTVSPRTPVDEALRLLSESALHQVPVVEGGRPVGLLGRADLLRFVEMHGSRPALESRSGARAGREGPDRGGKAVGIAPRRRRPGVPRPRRAGGGGSRTSCHTPRGR